MSTSAVDRNKNAETVSKNREQAKSQEAALKKKHAEEVKKLQQQYGVKVRELEKVHENQLESVRDRGQEALTAKDKKYLGEIEKIKTTQTQQVKNSAQNFEKQVKQQQELHDGELKKTEQVHESQMGSLSKNYENDVEKKEKTFTKAVDFMRGEQSEALSNQRNRLESKHSKETSVVRDTQDEKINQLTNDLQNTRETKNAEINHLKVENLSDSQEQKENTLSLVNQERKTQELVKENMRDNYSKNLDELRDKYSKANVSSRNGKGLELQDMEARAEGKNKEQIGALERRIRESNAKNDNEKFVAQKTFNQEKKNYMNATKEALDKSEIQRSMVYDSVNERTAQEIKDITSRNDASMDRQGAYYKGRLSEMDMKYGESIDTQVKGLEVENKQDRVNAEARQSKLVHVLGKERNDLESYYKEVIAEKDRINKETMTEQRMNLLKERGEAISKLEGRMRDVDAKNNEKTTQLINRYEREIGNLKDEHKTEKKRIIDQGNRRLDEAEKAFRFQLDTDKLAAKGREDQLKSKFESGMSTMEARHDEEKIRIATNIKK